MNKQQRTRSEEHRRGCGGLRLSPPGLGRHVRLAAELAAEGRDARVAAAVGDRLDARRRPAQKRPRAFEPDAAYLLENARAGGLAETHLGETARAVHAAKDVLRAQSLAGMLHSGTSIRPNTVNIFDILIGNFPGPMGASCILVLAAGMIFLAVRYRRAIVNTLSFLLACALLSVLFPRIYAGSVRPTSLLMELCSGLLIFAAVFFVTDPAISPRKVSHRFLYGFFSGIVCMLLRYFSNFEDSVCFGILIADAVWPAVEVRLMRREKKRRKARKTKAAAKEDTANA